MMTTKAWSTGWSSSPYKRLESPLPYSSNPGKCGDSDFFGPLAELVTQERPLASTLPEFNIAKVAYIYRKQLGHARPSLHKFKVNLN